MLVKSDVEDLGMMEAQPSVTVTERKWCRMRCAKAITSATQTMNKYMQRPLDTHGLSSSDLA